MCGDISFILYQCFIEEYNVFQILVRVVHLGVDPSVFSQTSTAYYSVFISSSIQLWLFLHRRDLIECYGKTSSVTFVKIFLKMT